MTALVLLPERVHKQRLNKQERAQQIRTCSHIAMSPATRRTRYLDGTARGTNSWLRQYFKHRITRATPSLSSIQSNRQCETIWWIGGSSYIVLPKVENRLSERSERAYLGYHRFSEGKNRCHERALLILLGNHLALEGDKTSKSLDACIPFVSKSSNSNRTTSTCHSSKPNTQNAGSNLCWLRFEHVENTRGSDRLTSQEIVVFVLCLVCSSRSFHASCSLWTLLSVGLPSETGKSLEPSCTIVVNHDR